jgi:hypothetical protein
VPIGMDRLGIGTFDAPGTFTWFAPIGPVAYYRRRVDDASLKLLTAL